MLMYLTPSLVILVSFIGDPSTAEALPKRHSKFFNVFQVVSFANGPCQGSSNRNGTCYTEQECASLGGSNSGTCASGFGVCCVFTVGCGQTSSQNCTYFESSGATAGCCEALICPCGDNICQLRLDFDTFTISGPSTQTSSVSKRRPHGGDVTADAAQDDSAVSVSLFGQCLTDTFSVSNPDGPNPPTICGSNSGEHMYVESSDCCNKLNFAFANQAQGAAIATRSWSIKVTQYSCNYNNLAPQGCTQYFFDSTNSNVRSYNYNNGNGIHLSSQDQNICVRRERNFCRICWTTVVDTDFAVTGTDSSFNINNPNICCSYAAAMTLTVKKGFDCVMIPGAQRDENGIPNPSNYCGNNEGIKGNTNCSTRTPFQLAFRSDKWESTLEAKLGGQKRNGGFQLVYFMDNMNCNPASITG